MPRTSASFRNRSARDITESIDVTTEVVEEFFLIFLDNGWLSTTMVNMSTRERLREAREKKGLSARALSRAAGLSHSTVAMFESGAREHMTTETVDKLCRALDISVEWLIRGESPANDSSPGAA